MNVDSAVGSLNVCISRSYLIPTLCIDSAYESLNHVSIRIPESPWGFWLASGPRIGYLYVSVEGSFWKYEVQVIAFLILGLMVLLVICYKFVLILRLGLLLSWQDFHINFKELKFYFSLMNINLLFGYFLYYYSSVCFVMYHILAPLSRC